MTGIFILGALGLFYTFSRSAWLALSGALLLSLVLYLRQRNRPAILAWISLVATTAIVMLPFLWKDASFIGIRLNWHRSFEQTPREEQSIGERALLNTVASQIFADHPLSGVGLGAFPLAMQRQFPDIPINYQPAHFVLLDVAAEIGIFGAFFYAVAMVTPFVLLWLNRKRQVISLHLVGISSLLLALIIVGMLDYYTWLLEPGRLWQWLAWGLWVVFFQLPFGEAASA